MTTPVHLRAAGVSLVLAGGPALLPEVVHWGADLGPLDEAALRALADTAVPPVVPNTMDQPVRLGVLPQHADGWPGLPGVSGHRDGRDWSPLLTSAPWVVATDPDGGGVVTVHAGDPVAHLGVEVRIRVEPSGLLRLQAVVTNEHPECDYSLEGVVLALPVPTDAAELLDLTGRWSKERVPQRRPFTVGAVMRDSRRGRTGHDASLLLAAGTPGFGFRSGEVWAVHTAWSGNHRTYAERLPSGRAVLGGGELLGPGEVRLRTGETYSTPWVYFAWSDVGLDGMSERLHRMVRAGRGSKPRPGRAQHLGGCVLRPRPRHAARRLADTAAEVGVERFVLDDGWFRGRRHDSRRVRRLVRRPRVWPDGLRAARRPRARLGMEFGLWVEPEMVNPTPTWPAHIRSGSWRPGTAGRRSP
jgi:alpha-galactosidase